MGARTRGLALLLVLACSSCSPGREEQQPQAGSEPLASPELAQSTATQPADPQLPAVLVTEAAVVLGTTRLARVEGGRLVGDRGALERALERAGAKSGGYALGVDRSAPFVLAGEVLAGGLKVGAARVELRVGSPQDSRALRVCAVAAAQPVAGADCWGRASQQPPAMDAGPSPGSARALDQQRAGERPAGDLGEATPTFAWDQPVDLTLSIEPDFVSVHVQGRRLRVLPNGRAAEPGLLGQQLRQTLEPLRNHNGWDRRAAVHTADAVPWEQLVEVLDALVDRQFDQIALTGIGQG